MNRIVSKIRAFYDTNAPQKFAITSLILLIPILPFWAATIQLISFHNDSLFLILFGLPLSLKLIAILLCPALAVVLSVIALIRLKTTDARKRFPYILTLMISFSILWYSVADWFFRAHYPAPRPAWMPFDSQKWKSVRSKLWQHYRYNMYDHLVIKYKLIGMTKEEVLDLLGSESFPETSKDSDLIYFMDGGSFLSGGTLLIIEFHNNRVTDFKTIEES